MRQDFGSGNFVGKGEDAAVLIISELTGLEEIRKDADQKFTCKEDGIYTQIALPWLLIPEHLKNLADHFDKSSVDVVVIKNEKIFCIRVQGRNHGHSTKKHGKFTIKEVMKIKRDNVARWMLETSDCIVIDFWWDLMPELFQDKVNEKSIKEVKDTLNSSKSWVDLMKTKKEKEN